MYVYIYNIYIYMYVKKIVPKKDRSLNLDKVNCLERCKQEFGKFLAYNVYLSEKLQGKV